MSQLQKKAGLLTKAVAGVALGLSALTTAQAEDPIRIAYIEPLSGPFANVGEMGLFHFRYTADRINEEHGGIMGRPIEIVPMDNRQSPSESAQLVQRAIDQGIQFVSQGNGSNVAGAIVETVDRHNRRNPDRRALYLNYAAIDPALTNDRCSFWHFRFDAESRIKMAALSDFMMGEEDVKKVYLLNQDYSHGHVVAAEAKRMLAEKRPDVEIVGEVLHPIGQVRDFSPYISRIRQSGADSVITGNWGNDLTLLIREANSAGLDVNFYTYYGGGLGVPAAVGDRGIGTLFQITEWHSNLPVEQGWADNEEWLVGYKERHPETDWYYQRVYNMFMMLKAAIEADQSTDPLDVAMNLRGMEWESPTGTVYIREDDHQVHQDMYISVMAEQDGDQVKHDTENSGVGFRTVAKVDWQDTVLPTSCNMRMPR